MEKNIAPKWMEGQYVLTIKGNKVTIEAPNGPFGQMRRYEARCHPDDRFTIEDAIAEVFKKKYDDETKIRVGDMVVPTEARNYDSYAQWVNCHIQGANKCRFAYSQTVKMGKQYRVLYVGKHDEFDSITLAYIQRYCGNSVVKGECYLVDVDNLKKVTE